MTVLYLERFPVHPSRTLDFVPLVEAHALAMRSANGVLWADAARCAEDDPSYFLASEWRTEKSADNFRTSEISRLFEDECLALVREASTLRRFVSESLTT